MLHSPQDILILSNGPGEITTWVYPVVKKLRKRLSVHPQDVRISVILSPCPHSTGKELELLQKFPEIDRVQGAEGFYPFLLWGKTQGDWDWRDQGVIVFLGGDQFFPLLIRQRLGYPTVIYAEWEARWYRWLDYFGVMKPEGRAKLPQPHQAKCTVVGDLMADFSAQLSPTAETETEVIGLLPGSKAAKLAQGVPLCFAIAQKIHARRPQTQFILPLAPTLTITELAKWADPTFNRLMETFATESVQLITTADGAYFHTQAGLKIKIMSQFPAHEALAQCRLCLTTVGANTAQLGSLGIPMLVLIPTQQLDAMRSWDGLPGILANLPLVGRSFAKLINWGILAYLSRHQKLYAWPNIWANREIVPELIGHLNPSTLAETVINYLEHPEQLQAMHHQLLTVRGETGATAKFVDLIFQALAQNSCVQDL